MGRDLMASLFEMNHYYNDVQLQDHMDHEHGNHKRDRAAL